MVNKIFVNLPVNDLDKSMNAGGTETYSPKDYGFMFVRSFEDLDGHV